MDAENKKKIHDLACLKNLQKRKIIFTEFLGLFMIVQMVHFI